MNPSDGAGPDVRDLLEDLLERLLAFARALLDDHGEFFPFAGVVTADDEIEVIVPEVGTEQPRSEELVEMLYGQLVDSAVSGDITGSALCVNVMISTELTGDTDAVQVSLESGDGDPLDVFLPYRLSGGEAAYGELLAADGERRVFV